MKKETKIFFFSFTPFPSYSEKMADFEDPAFGNGDHRHYDTKGPSDAENQLGFFVIGILRGIFSFVEAMFYSKHDAWTFVLFVGATFSLCCACVCFARTLFTSSAPQHDVNAGAKKVQ